MRCLSLCFVSLNSRYKNVGSNFLSYCSSGGQPPSINLTIFNHCQRPTKKRPHCRRDPQWMKNLSRAAFLIFTFSLTSFLLLSIWIAVFGELFAWRCLISAVILINSNVMLLILKNLKRNSNQLYLQSVDFIKMFKSQLTFDCVDTKYVNHHSQVKCIKQNVLCISSEWRNNDGLDFLISNDYAHWSVVTLCKSSFSFRNIQQTNKKCPDSFPLPSLLYLSCSSSSDWIRAHRPSRNIHVHKWAPAAHDSVFVFFGYF